MFRIFFATLLTWGIIVLCSQISCGGDIPHEPTIGLTNRAINGQDLANADMSIAFNNCTCDPNGRLYVGGTDLTTNNVFSFNAGWGNPTATLSGPGFPKPVDSAWVMKLVPTQASLLYPTMTLTFIDGPWTGIPVCLWRLVFTDDASVNDAQLVGANDDKIETITIQHAVTPNKTYIFASHCIGTH